MIHLDIKFLHNSIEALLAEYPVLAEDDVMRADMFEAETDLHGIIIKLLDASREASSMADAIKIRMQEITVRKARYERKEEAFRALIQKILEHADIKKLELPEATLSLRSIAPAPFVTDPALIPEDCTRIKREPDMKAIKAAIEEGREVPGTAMSNGKISLTIRTA